MILQRYVRERWPALRGERPFIVTGPNFAKWCRDGKGMKPFDRCTRELTHQMHLSVLECKDDSYLQTKLTLCEMLLQSGIVQALWLESSPLDDKEKLPLSIAELAGEVPFFYHGTGICDDVLELLDGMSSPEYIRHHMLHETDRAEVVLVPLNIAV